MEAVLQKSINTSLSFIVLMTAIEHAYNKNRDRHFYSVLQDGKTAGTLAGGQKAGEWDWGRGKGKNSGAIKGIIRYNLFKTEIEEIRDDCKRDD